MNGNQGKRVPNSRAGGAPLPELDLDENEMAAMGPAFNSARAPGPPGSIADRKAPPPPPLNDAVLRLPEQNLELDMPVSQGTVTKYRPPVRGVTCGTTRVEEPLSEAEKRQGEQIANYAAVPANWWRFGIYAFHILKRQRDLKGELSALQASASQAQSGYERAVVAFGERTRSASKAVIGGSADRGSVGSLRAAGASAAPTPDGQPALDPAERATIEFAFRALDDARTFGQEFDGQRAEINGLQELAERRARAVRVHEYALHSHDARAVQIGLVTYLGGGTLLILFVFSPVIWRSISPPALEPLPPLPADSSGVKR